MLTPAEEQDLARKFSDKLQPAVQRWCKAYDGHLPFKAEDVTLDKFREQIGRNANFTIYTFMIREITLCVQENQGRAMVSYLNSPRQTRSLEKLPGGELPNLQMPLQMDEVISMVKADSGTEFKPKDIVMRPSSKGSALNGGATVDIGPLGGDPNNGLCKVSLVFGPDGNLVYYCRDPFFFGN